MLYARQPRRCAKINVKFVVIIVSVLVVLGVGAVVARHFWRKYRAAQSLADGTAAVERKDWPEAAKHFAEYLSRRPKDCDVLRKYAEALLSIRPLEQRHLYQATWAYRQLLNLQGHEESTYRKLADLYTYSNNAGELAYVARKRLELAPGDPAASIWLARSHIRQQKFDEAWDGLVTLEKDLARKNGKHPEYVQACRMLGLIASQPSQQRTHDPKDPIVGAKDLMSLRDFTGVRMVLMKEEKRLAQREGRHFAYVQACTMLSLSAAEENALTADDQIRQWADRVIRHDPQSPEAILFQTLRKSNASDKSVLEALQAVTEHWTVARKWAERAVDYDPKSPDACWFRAGLLRATRESNPAVREALLAAARADLQRTEALAPPDPGIWLVLCEEWIEHGDFDRATAALGAAGRIPDQTLEEHYVDRKDWTLAKFLLAARLAARPGAVDNDVALADEALSTLTARHHRIRVLPPAVRLYLAGRKVDRARQYLNEYMELRRIMQTHGDELELALLKAMVAWAEGKHYEVIHVLRPFAAEGTSSASVWHLLGLAYTQTGQSDRARQALRRYLTLNPTDREMTLLLAVEHLAQGQWHRARQTAGKVERHGHKDVTATLMQIEAAFHLAAQQHDPKRSQSIKALSDQLAKLRESQPKDPRIPALQATAASLLAQPKRGEQVLRKAIAECDTTLNLELQLAGLYVAQNRPADAEAVCRTACKKHPQAVSPWRVLAQLQRDSGKVGQARQTLRQGMKALPDPKPQRVLKRSLADLEILRGDRSAGIQMLRDLAESDATDVQTRSLLLALPEILRDKDAAQKLIDQIRKVQGDNSLLWRRHQGRLWLADEGSWRPKHAEIAAKLKEWVDTEPHWTFPALLLAQLHQRLGKSAKAEARCRRTLALNPSDVVVADFLIALLEEQTRFEEAEKVLEELGTGPRRIISERLVRRALVRKDVDQAIRELKLRLADSPGGVRGYVLLARLVYRQSKDAKAALGYLDQAAAVRPDSVAVAATRAAILHAQGRSNEALAVLETHVNKTRSFGAYLLRARYLTNRGNHAAAEKDYVHLTSLEPRSRGYGLLADFLQSRSRPDDAIAALDHGLAACGQNASLQRTLVKVLLQRGRKDDLTRAGKVLDALEKDLGRRPDLLWYRAVLLRAHGPDQTQKAQQTLEKLIEIRPASVRAHLALAEMAMQQGQPKRARALLGRALGANPANVPLLLAQAQLELALRDHDTAAKACLRVIELQPTNTTAPRVLGSLAASTSDPRSLRRLHEVIRQALAKRPHDQALQVANAQVLRKLGDTPAAIAKLKAHVAGPDGGRSFSSHLALARLYRENGDLTAAAAQLDEAARRKPNSTALLAERFRFLAARREFDQIASLIAARSSGDNPDAGLLIAAGQMLASSGDKKHVAQAEHLHKRATDLAPKRTDVKMALAALSLSLGKADHAETTYRQVLGSSADNVAALNGLAWTLATERKDYPAALPLADKAVKLAPADSYVRDTRGAILAKLPGRLSDARKEFEISVALSIPHSPRRAKSLLQLGEICSQLRDTLAARKHLAEALRIDQKTQSLTPDQRTRIAKILSSLPQTPKTQPSGSSR